MMYGIMNIMVKLSKDRIRYLIYKIMGSPSLPRRIEWRKMLKWLSPEKDGRILDIACGGGWLSLKLAEQGLEVYALDMSEDAIRSAKRLSNAARIPCEFKVGDAERLPYHDESFDTVTCSSALEHFNNDIDALREMRRVLKPNGKLVLSVDSLTCPVSDELREKHRRNFSVVNYYTKSTLEERCEISGLTVCRSEYLLKSRFTNFFFKIGVELKFMGIFWTVVSIIAYPLCLISERLSGLREQGNTLMAELKKI